MFVQNQVNNNNNVQTIIDKKNNIRLKTMSCYFKECRRRETFQTSDAKSVLC